LVLLIFYRYLYHLFSETKLETRNRIYLYIYTGCASESGDFAKQFFFLFGNTGKGGGRKPLIAILLTTSNHYSYNGSRGLEHKVLFAVKAFYKHDE
jgi:hypothetical protein